MVRINTTNPIGDAASSYNGPYNLSSPNWDRVQATIGEEVKLSVAIQSYPNAAVTFTIWKDGANRESDMPIARLSGPSENGQAETKWRYVYNEAEEGPLTEKPKFVFEALAFGCDPVESGVCEFGTEADLRSKGGFKEKLTDTIFELPSESREISSTPEGIAEGDRILPGEDITVKDEAED